MDGNTVVVARGPDGDVVTVNGVVIPGASLMFRDALRVVVSIPAATQVVEMDRPQTRRIALEE
jgi:hypothetical protein